MVPSTVVIAGSAGGTPLLRQLAQAFRAESGMVIQVESPIGNDGSRLALADKRIDGAIVVESSTEAIDRGCTSIAQTAVVVAIGPGIQTQSLSTNDLIGIVGGRQKRWAGGLQKNSF